eukprot:2882126-Pleurochrysis_carterae.AAC.5
MLVPDRKVSVPDRTSVSRTETSQVELEADGGDFLAELLSGAAHAHAPAFPPSRGVMRCAEGVSPRARKRVTHAPRVNGTTNARRASAPCGLKASPVWVLFRQPSTMRRAFPSVQRAATKRVPGRNEARAWTPSLHSRPRPRN